MKKLSGLLAVSLVAIMMAPAARADIASTEYVNKNMEAKTNKVTDTKNYTGDEDSTEKYPSMAVANQMAKSVAAKSVAGKLSNTFSNKKNQVMVTDAKGAVTPTTVDTEGAGNAVTAVTVADGKYTVTKGTTFATKAQLNTTNTNVTNLTTRVSTAEGTIETLKTSKQDNLTAGTGIKIENNTISTDGLATDADLTTLQKTVAGHTTSIDKLDGAATVTGSVKQQIQAAKSDLTTSIEANTTAAANAKSAADAAQLTANKAVVANTAITGGTKTKITYDAKGLVTGGSDLTADDIPALATGKITGLDEALAAKFVAPGTSVTSKDGTYTLTMKVADGKPTYAWEEIGR